jgi:hypothetical protein
MQCNWGAALPHTATAVIAPPPPPEALFRDRYAPAFEIYEKLSLPLQDANIVLDNRDFETATARIIRPVETRLSHTLRARL